MGTSCSIFGFKNSVTFPLKISSNGRYITQFDNTPLLICGDAGWNGILSLSLADWNVYLRDRKSKGFNTVLLQLSSSISPTCPAANNALCFSKNSSGTTWDGDPNYVANWANFNGNNGGLFHFDAALDQPNDIYFSMAKQFVDAASQLNMICLITPNYFGINSNTTNAIHDGWSQTNLSTYNTQAKHLAFGQYLGTKFANSTNIIWDLGVDTAVTIGSELSARLHNLAAGIKQASSGLWLGHWSVSENMTLGSDQTDFSDIFNVQGVYTHGPYPSIGPTYGNCRRGYTANVGPVLMAETTYEGEHSITNAQLRDLMWWSALSSIGGQIFGNSVVWQFTAGWQSSLNTTGTQDFQRMITLLNSYLWYNLVPSGLAGSATIITSGGGTFTTITNSSGPESGGMDWCASARTPDGKLILAYVPSAYASSGIVVDMTLLSNTANAIDYNPATGSSSSLGSFANTGTRTFSSIAAGHLLILQAS